MAARFDLVTIDSPATDRLAAFWRQAADLVEVEREDGDRWIVLADRSGQRRVGIQRGRHRPGGLHLDLACEPNQFLAEVERLQGLGAVARTPPRHEPYGWIANLADPDGNPFDLCGYT
ncbi:MAG: VOC family protein [Actinomycetota bacterium]